MERAGLLAGVQMRKLKTTKEESYGLNGKIFEKAVLDDLPHGLKPIFVCRFHQVNDNR